MLIGGAYAPRRPEQLNIYRYYLRSCVTPSTQLNHFSTISAIRRWRELILYGQAFQKQSCQKNYEELILFCFYLTVFKKSVRSFFTILISFHFILKYQEL